MPAPAWVGWLREGRSPWRPVAEGDTYSLAWDALIAYPALAPHVERLVLRRGEHPTTKRKGRL